MEGEGKSVEMKIDEKRDYLIQLNNKRFLIENGYWNDSPTDGYGRRSYHDASVQKTERQKISSFLDKTINIASDSSK